MSSIWWRQGLHWTRIGSRFLSGANMKTIEDHIAKDKEILADPKTSEPMRHHIEDELHDLEEYVEHHKDEIEAGDHHDPNVLEVFCDVHPDEPECLVYDD